MAIRYKKNKITNSEAIIKWGLLGALKIKRMIFCNKVKRKKYDKNSFMQTLTRKISIQNRDKSTA